MKASNVLAAARVATGLLLVAWAVGCGDSDDGAGGASTAALSGDEQEIRATLSDMGERMAASDGAGVCEYLTSSASRHIVAATRRLAEEPGGFASKADAASCATVYDSILSGKVIEDFDPRILSVRINGERAVVAARSSHDKQQRQYAQLARENGQWRVALWFARDTATGRVDKFLNGG